MDEQQTITFDDFEQSLIEDGIEIIVPAEEEEVEGVGASGYKPRLTAPSATNPYYLKYGKGGYNRCILISGNSCLPNCVGYSFGRLLEQGGATENSKIPTCNAEDWLVVAKNNGLKTGQTPKLGAVIVWKSGNLWNGSDGCGHVGIVEEIAVDGTITVGQSNYGGTRFFITKHKPPYSIIGQTFIGFVYSPYVEGMWKKDKTGWWYEYADGSYPKNKWEKIDGKWYHFDDRGYMQTGWICLNGKWYYLKSDGAMATGWIKDGEKWYFLNNDGVMQTGWINDKNKWYYLGSDGAMFIGKHNCPCYFDKTGALVRKD